MHLSIVLPAYNEEARIDESLTTLVGYLSEMDYQWEVIVVDDGSTDATTTLVERHVDGEYISLLRLSHQGKGAAVKAGMIKGKGRYRMMCDVDLAMPVQWISKFLASMERGHDLVIGSRQINGAHRFNEPVFRHVMGRLFNYCVQLVAVSEFEDTQCGFKCFTSKAVEQLFPLQLSRGFGFDVELLYLAKRAKLDVLEIPIDWYHQPNSKVRPAVDSVLMLRDALTIRLNSLLGRY